MKPWMRWMGWVAVGCAGWMTRAGQATPPALPRGPDWILQQPLVAGLRYHVAPEEVSDWRAGDPLELRADWMNPCDRYAVEILHAGRRIGYLPRTDNRATHRLLRQGAPVKCRILKVHPDRGPWMQVRVEVCLET